MPDIDNPTDIGSAAADAAPVDLEPVTDTRDIDWLSSTTTKRTRRTAIQEPEVSVEHVARFGVRPGSLIDISAEYSRTASFRPEFLQARWDDGVLKSVTLSGSQRLKSGGVSDKLNRKREWREYGRHAVDKADLPQAVADALTAYETAVATDRNGARR